MKCITLLVFAIAISAALGSSKIGNCPAADKISLQLTKTLCNDDNECRGNLKCCPSKMYSSNICYQPCPIMMVKCTENHEVKYVEDPDNGCQLATCVAVTQETVPASQDPDCLLPKKTGPCRAMFNQYYYDQETNECKDFIYGGCSGNANRFKSVEECQNKCKKAGATPSNEVKTGSCPIPKVVFGGRSASCKHDSECGGDFKCCYSSSSYTEVCAKPCPGVPITCPEGQALNAETLNAATGCYEEKCVPVAAERKSGTCPIPKVVLGGRSASCKHDSECGGDFKCCYSSSSFTEVCAKPCSDVPITCPPGQVVNAETLNVATGCYEEKCVAVKTSCLLPKKEGPCRGSLTRFYYDDSTKKCTEFKYGGCLGNENNFKSLENCQENCSMPDPEDDPADLEDNDAHEDAIEAMEELRCSLPAETGMCKARLPRYHFNNRTNQCEEFTFGGCGGNANNFQTLAECNDECEPKKDKTICSLPKDYGPCKGFHLKYWFDSSRQRCRPFTYGGCQGNANNFNTNEECTDHCLE